MIGNSKYRDMVQTLQDEASNLQAQVTTFGEQLAVLCLQAVTQHEVAQLEDRIASLEVIVATQAEALQAHVREIDSFQKLNIIHEEEIKQLQGRFARIERQAALDLDEMRRTNTALANTVLLKRLSENTR